MKPVVSFKWILSVFSPGIPSFGNTPGSQEAESVRTHASKAFSGKRDGTSFMFSLSNSDSGVSSSANSGFGIFVGAINTLGVMDVQA